MTDRLFVNGPLESLQLQDGPSLVLAPLVIRQIFRTLAALRDETGLSIILVKQDAEAALRIADRGYVMQRARRCCPAPARRCGRTR